MMIGVVIVPDAGGMAMNCEFGPNFVRCSFAGGANGQPRVKVAAAERHRHCEEQGDQEPEWTASVQHTSGEYIPAWFTALATAKFDRLVGIARGGSFSWRALGCGSREYADC